MTDPDLDDLLRQSAASPSEEARATSVELAREIRDEVSGAFPLRRRRRSVGRTAIAAAAAVVALTGAGTLAAYQLSIPPFQTLDDGVERARTGIPVDYVDSAGRAVECLAFIEYRNLSTDQRAAVETASRDSGWQGYGQRVLDDLDIPVASPEEQYDALSEVVHDDLWRAAREAVPGLVYMSDSDGPVFAGTSMSCTDLGGVDGRP